MISRTVLVGSPLGVAPRGTLPTPMPLVFPNKTSGETLDYAVDFTNQFSGGAVTALANASVTPSPFGELVVSNVETNGLVVSFNLAGGTAGTMYVLSVAANGPSPISEQVYVGIYVDLAPVGLSDAAQSGSILTANL